MPHTTEAISDIEIKDCDKAYDGLIQNLRPKLKGNDLEMLDKAYELALNAHKFQRRKSGEAYMHHPIAVARIAHEEIGLGPTAVICALLHDVVEDTPVELTEILDIFGPKVSRIVDGLTKLDGLYNVGNTNAENLRKVLSTLVEDVRVVLIKMADRIHNLRTIGAMPTHKQIKIAAETEFIYAPLAHRLGLYKVKSEFEDIILQITDPEVYLEIQENIKASEDERQKFIDTVLKPIRNQLDDLDLSYRILSRVKATSSIYQKIKNKNVPLKKIYDIFAIRIILNVPLEEEKTACWHVYSIITDFYKPIPERLKDWITSPKGNGYESLHTTIIGPKGRFVEVQIRSERMDDIAERGFAAHWKYKGQKSENSVYDGWLDNIRTLLDDQEGDAIDFLNDFKTNLFKKEVYVFTPNGEMRILPLGATALDFAFDIHSDIGAKATAIKVNEKLVPMGYKLENGDQVSVTTSKNQKPTKGWLNIVVTGKARSKIRQSINNQKKVQAELGKEIIMRKLKNMKVDFEENMDFLYTHYDFKNRVDFYVAISEEIVKTSDFKKFSIDNGKFVVKKEEAKEQDLVGKSEQKRIPKKQKAPLKPVLINGEENSQYEYQLSKCCNPVKGDEIFAFVSSNQGLKIHRKNCKNASNLFTNYGYRILKAEWQGLQQNTFLVDLKITGVDTGIGVIQSITDEISNKQGINIKSFSIEGLEGIFEGSTSLEVKNLEQLKKVIKKLKNIEGINNVQRITKEELG